MSYQKSQKQATVLGWFHYISRTHNDKTFTKNENWLSHFDDPLRLLYYFSAQRMWSQLKIKKMDLWLHVPKDWPLSSQTPVLKPKQKYDNAKQQLKGILYFINFNHDIWCYWNCNQSSIYFLPIPINFKNIFRVNGNCLQWSRICWTVLNAKILFIWSFFI